MKRREFFKVCGSASLVLAANPCLTAQGAKAIDRSALVRRHNPLITEFDPNSAWSLGNGEFAFTADVTGLQTFADACASVFPLCTTAHWAWHSFAMPADLASVRLRLKDYDTHGRQVGYRTDSTGQERLFNHLRTNPHRLHLGRISFISAEGEGQMKPEQVQQIAQKLDLWTGILTSKFQFQGKPVEVQTSVHPEIDQLAVRIRSPLLATGALKVQFAFPYGSPEVPMADWKSSQLHSTAIEHQTDRQVRLRRSLDTTEYWVAVNWSRGTFKQTAAHEFALEGSGPELEFVCAFTQQSRTKSLPDQDSTAKASEKHWRKFWSSGGVIDLSGSRDPRAEVLERRTVRSLYQTAVHCAGSLPSAETGLLFNSWYGKFHLEMHWWHSVHFTAWNRFELFERSLGLYGRILPVAQDLARSQGYVGARWPKMIGPDGHDSPSPVGPLLIWQQPHPIYYAELCYRKRPGRRTLDKWKQVVFESADFMADYAVYDRAKARYVLGPPMKTVSENTDPLTAINPTFELSYWRYGLRVAQTWRERLGLECKVKWDDVQQNLSPLPVADGLYLMQENLPDTYTKWNWEHPALVGAYGMLPGDGVDPEIMKATVRKVSEVWQWDRTWGWDFGMMAMAAARTNQPELAIQALLVDVPKNRYWPNGHNYQRPNLTAYLPGNGSFLCAMAMMAAGWTGSEGRHAPGFPADGKWQVRWEGLERWL